TPRDSSRAISDAWPPMGTAVPKLAATLGEGPSRAANAVKMRQLFQRIYVGPLDFTIKVPSAALKQCSKWLATAALPKLAVYFRWLTSILPAWIESGRSGGNDRAPVRPRKGQLPQ